MMLWKKCAIFIRVLAAVRQIMNIGPVCVKNVDCLTNGEKMKNFVIGWLCYSGAVLAVYSLSSHGLWLVLSGIPLGLLLKPRFGIR